jgi:hypothetical protein
MKTKTATLIILTAILTVFPLAAASAPEGWGVDTNNWPQFQQSNPTLPPTITPTEPPASPTAAPTAVPNNPNQTSNPTNQPTAKPTIPETTPTILVGLITTITILLSLLKIKGSKLLPN